jgi:NTE family protein
MDSTPPSIKVGLALSGGGFRAAFFHVGVLARLAELGILPQVEVLSTVSGGSIVGALYYLHVKRLLDSSPQPTAQDFVILVKRVEKELFQGVQRNLRMRTFLSPFAVVHMLASEDYTRTTRMGELYERDLYAKVWGEILEQPGSATQDHARILLKDLLIRPGGKLVKPKLFNKVTHTVKMPDLVINATSLNSGRYWRFSATKLGETLADNEVRAMDKNECKEVSEQQIKDEREQHYYRFSAVGHKRPLVVPEALADTLYLGKAVGASSAVPGIFAPVPITDLYDTEEYGANQIIHLVDGGVYDNQGLEHLFREDCTHIIASDGSGPFFSEPNPSDNIPGVLARTNEAMMRRIRTHNIKELGLRMKCRWQTDSGVQGPEVSESAFFHLRQSSCKGSPFKKDYVEAIAHIRTDLDSFSEIEACSLMVHGYMLSDWKLTDYCPALVTTYKAPGKQQWDFQGILTELQKNPDRVLRHLKVGRHKFFRLFRLWREPAVKIACPRPLVLLGLVGYLVREVLIGVDLTAEAAAFCNRIGGWLA